MKSSEQLPYKLIHKESFMIKCCNDLTETGAKSSSSSDNLHPGKSV